MPSVRRRRGVGDDEKVSSPLPEAVRAARNVPLRRQPKQKQKPFLATWEAAPEHARDNIFIRAGYRAGHDFKAAVASVFKLHNESGNIWTHLLGFFIFIILTAVTTKVSFPLTVTHPRLLQALEHSLQQAATSMKVGHLSMYDALQAAEAWEHAVVERLKKSRPKSVDHIAEELGSALKSIGTHNLAELRGVAHRIGEEVTALEGAIGEAVARLLKTSPVARWPMHVFTAGAMACLLTSSTCHVFGCCTAHIAKFMWRFDYAGIALLIVASFYPPVYYGFLCRPHFAVLYLSSTTLLGLSTLCITVLDRFQDPEWHEKRAGLFVALGVWGAVPLGHGAWLHVSEPSVATALVLELVMGAVYLIGAAIYAARVPERWAPGAFDVAFHSHQLFHVAVVLAAVIHYKACMLLLEWREATAGCIAGF